MKRILFAIIFLALFPITAHAQSAACPTNSILTWQVAQWQTCLNSLAPSANASLTTPSIAGGVVSGSIVQPAGGIGAIVTIDVNSPTLTLGVSLNQTVITNLASASNVSIILPASTNWPACPASSLTACPVYVIKDGFGNASAYPITITALDGKGIDGLASYMISSNYGSVKLVLNGSAWNIVP